MPPIILERYIHILRGIVLKADGLITLINTFLRHLPLLIPNLPLVFFLVFSGTHQVLIVVL